MSKLNQFLENLYEMFCQMMNIQQKNVQEQYLYIPVEEERQNPYQRRHYRRNRR